MVSVIISGIGLVSILGQSNIDHFECLDSCYTRLAMQTDGSYSQIVNHIEINDIKSYIKNKKSLKFFGLDTVLGCICSKLALSDAEIFDEIINSYSEEFGIIIGSCYESKPLELGEIITNYIDEENKINYKELGELGIREIPPLWMVTRLPNTVAGQISIENNIKGINLSLVNGMNSGIVSIGEAFLAIKQKRVKRVICGGVDDKINPEFLHQMKEKGLLASSAIEAVPFGITSKGNLFTEGGSVLILEKKVDDNRNGYAQICGYCNRYIPNIDYKDEQEISMLMKECMKEALMDACIIEENVDFIQSSAGGNQLLDRAEAIAIRDMFKNHVFVTSCQSYIGNTRVAQGAFSVAVSCLSFKEKCIFPILTEGELYLENEINYIKGKKHEYDAKVCIVNSFSYLGEICTLVLRKS